MSFAPPVSRGNFHYNGNLYVDVGQLNRHQRASVDEISALLRPDLLKKSSNKKASLDPPRDQVGHWYEAQLIHYGLPPSKDKARAKMRLLEALNNAKLTVPPNIVNMEAEMKKEYAAAERKAKALYKASQAPASKGESSAAGQKRKQSESFGNFPNINVNINFGSDYQGFPGSTSAATNGQSPAKKAKTGTSKPTNKKADEDPPKAPKKTAASAIKQPPSQMQDVQKRPRQTAKNPQLTEAWLKDPSIGPGPIDRATGLSRLHPSEMSSGTISWAKMEPVAKIASKIKQEPTPKVEKKVKKEPGVKREPKTDSSLPSPPSLGLINGLYDLFCPTVSENWSHDDLTLTLTLDGTTIWGAYDLGMFSGIIFLPSRPWQASSNHPLPFTWRGRENGEGEMSFGHGCEGEIWFLGDGEIEGWISVYGRCEFRGVRRAEAGTAVRPKGHMKAEWDGYNEWAYEEERVGRWR